VSRSNASIFSVQLYDIDNAYRKVCQQRLHFPHNSDIWWLRKHWSLRRTELLAILNSGDYLFSPLQCVCKKNGQFIHLWSSEDAIVINVLKNILQEQLHLSSACTHVKGHGGLKRTVVNVQSVSHQRLSFRLQN
jgi:hypothetical protein